MSGAWTRLAVKPSDAGHRETVSAALFAAGAQGLHEDGEWLVTHLEPGSASEPYVAAVHRADAACVYDVTSVTPMDWTATMRERIGAHTLGVLTVAPPWLAEGRDPLTTIIIEPAMAFGTGEHATTRGVVRLMQGVIRAGDTVADLGAGSAVLAIAAAKLGASRIAAIEMDPDAISNAEENVLRNHAAGRVTVIEGDAAVLLPLVAPVRVVLANIISSVLLELLPVIAASLAPGGVAILSGILAEEREKMLTAVAANGWRVLAEDAEEQWWSVVIARGRA
ncbi:MAG: 50S ribosomal protein L11 methyltransferase [Gemmatimonadetes bacterium]|nr:50S ribosomal protein L11 methyltransferase [Gemmatimonadota bacterium]